MLGMRLTKLERHVMRRLARAGGVARAKKLTDAQKSDIARLGGLAKAAKAKATA